MISTQNETTKPSRSAVVGILLIFALLWFATLGSRRLLDPDEGRYAEISREMLATGDWLTPRLDGLKYFEKPALQYWMTAGAYRVFGQNEFAARLWTGLTGFAGVVLAWFVGARLFGRAAGLMAASVLASSLLYVAIGHLTTLDMSLTFFLQLSVSSFLLAQRAAYASKEERNWMLLAWAAAGLAFLSKGLVALLLPALTLIVYTAFTREYSAWKRLHILTGAPLFLLVSAPWIVAVSRANPEFPQFFFLHEQFERFLTTVHKRDAPWWYFIPLFALGALPWTSVLVQTAKSSWQNDVSSGFQPKRFLMLWIAVVIVFFSASHSKLPPYIAPVFPATALVLGAALTRIEPRFLQRHFLIAASLLFAIGIAVVCLPDDIAGPNSIDLVKDLRPETAAGLLLSAGALFAATWALRRYPVQIVVAMAGLGALASLSVLIYGSDALRATRSGYDLAQGMAPYVSPATRLYSVGDYQQSLPFYLRRTMTLVDYRGELDFGLTQEPALGIDDLEDFARAWNSPSQAVAVMSETTYHDLLDKGLPMHLIAQQHKLIAVRKPQ